MIHVFSYRDKNYIYDVGSGSLHECDKTTADYLKAKEEGQDVDITYISDEEIKNILADVEGLKEQGLLFKDEVNTYPMKSDEVKALCIHVRFGCQGGPRQGHYEVSYDLSRNYTVCAGIGSIQYYLIENAPQFCGAFFCRHRKNTGFRVLSTV